MVAIYGTLGPACADRDTLRGMIAAGMTGIRLNISHTDIDKAAGQIQALHAAEEDCGTKVDLLIDMQGPELRIGELSNPLQLQSGSEVQLGEGGIPVQRQVQEACVKGQAVLLDDGKILLEILDAGENICRAKVIRGGVLTGKKSIALPGRSILLPVLTERDKYNLQLAAAYGVTGIMQPFVRNRKDLEDLRREADAAGGENLRIFAKIENLDGVSHLDELIPACDEIVIARGDLGNAVPLWKLPALQKKIADACRRAEKPFMVVTQMLTSMETKPVPTRAEVSDIFNAVLDGAASVMVTGETAAGSYPVEVIRYLANTVREGESFLQKQ